MTDDEYALFERRVAELKERARRFHEDDVLHEARRKELLTETKLLHAEYEVAREPRH